MSLLYDLSGQRRKPECWILKHNEDGRILCNDGRRRAYANIERFKMYRHLGHAMRRAGTEYTCCAVYEGELVTRDGKIERGW
jgi:hypothetical protein